MIKVCTECGKSFECLYPDIWVYKRFQHYYCTWKCYRKDHNEMARMKKDGTPAKKPGPKPKDGIAQVKVDGALRIETPEADMIEIVETPENTKRVIKRRGDFEISAIRDAELGEFYYDQKFNSIDWRTEEGDEISLPPIGWKNLMQEMPDILKALGVDK